MLGFIVITSSALAGLFHVTPLVIVLCAVLLCAITTIESRSLYQRTFASGDFGRSLAYSCLAMSLVNGTIAASAGYMLGAVMALMI